MAHVHFTRNLLRHGVPAEVEAEGATLRDVLRGVVAIHPRLESDVVDLDAEGTIGGGSTLTSLPSTWSASSEGSRCGKTRGSVDPRAVSDSSRGEWIRTTDLRVPNAAL